MATLLLIGAMASGASAQDLTDRATERCVQAAVRLEVDVGRGGTSTGSGSIIDARGYVLTNFHVVGLSRHESGMGVPGTLYGDGAHVRVATVSSARDSARSQYLGRVVRGDIRLDMAIVRIVSMADGSPLPDGTVFPTIELTDTTGINPGAAVWAFGFPMGVRTINVTSGNISGFEMNTDGEVAWIRTDVEFNPGNSGGMLVDRRGRLIAVPTAVVSGRETLEPIELARPVERMPAGWRTALASAVPIDDVIITGVSLLTTTAVLTDSAVGDTSGMGREEIHYYALPGSAATGIVTITTAPPMPVALINVRGTVVREGHGTLMIGPGEATGGAVALLLERADDGSPTPVSLRTEVTARPVATAPPAGYPASPTAPGGYPGYPPGYAGGAAGSGAGSASASAVVVRGRLVDERTGAPVVGGVVYIAPAGVDLVSMLALWQSGRISEAQFRAALVGFAITDATGAYAITNIPRGRFSGVSAAPGYATSPLTLTITPTDATVIDVTPIRMRR
jgi:serine protease Do